MFRRLLTTGRLESGQCVARARYFEVQTAHGSRVSAEVLLETGDIIIFDGVSVEDVQAQACSTLRAAVYSRQLIVQVKRLSESRPS